MKKTFIILAVALMVLIITAMTLTSVKGIIQKEAKFINSGPIPDSLNKIFMKSCAYCHSDGGKLLAKTKINFPKWDDYTQKEKITKAADICDMLSQGDMPPKKARKSKPELIPTESQIKSICKWAQDIAIMK